MQFHTLGKRLPKGLDDGTTTATNQPPGKKSKKRKLDTTDDSPITTTTGKEAPAAPPVQPQPPPPTAIPTILPGERLSDFAARVDQALPITGLLRHGTDKPQQPGAAKVPGGLKERPTTKHNKRLERMQKEWRAAEKRRVEKREEERDEWEDEQEEQGVLWDGIVGQKRRKKAGSQKRKKGIIERDENADDDEDPWKALERRKAASTKQRNLQDVVQAPPDLKMLVINKGSSNRFKDLGGGVGVDVQNVPGRAGSLRKREELGEARRNVIDGYRKRTTMMMGRRGRELGREKGPGAM